MKQVALAIKLEACYQIAMAANFNNTRNKFYIALCSVWPGYWRPHAHLRKPRGA